MDKYIIRGHALFENFHQNEICIRFVNFHGFPGQQLLIDPFTLGRDQVSGAADIVPVIEHIGACQFSQTVDGPGIHLLLDIFQQLQIRGHGIAKTKSRSGEEFGDAAQNRKVIKFLQQTYGAHTGIFRSKFCICLIHHKENVMFPAALQDLSHVIRGGGCGGGIVRIADNAKFCAVF